MIDLHAHTNCSDGDYSPLDLIKLAAKKGVRALAITDHDTVSAYQSDIVSFAKRHGISLIKGIEFSTIDRLSSQKVHVVGLNIDTDNTQLRAVCRQISDARMDFLIQTKQKLQSIGVTLRVDDIMKSTSVITKSHIGRDVVSNPANLVFLMQAYGKTPKHGAFIDDYLMPGRSAHVELPDKFMTDTAVDVVRSAGGKAICAHPSFNVLRGFTTESMQQLILRNNFDGVETINIQYDKNNDDQRFDMVAEFADFADRHQLLVSGGSDFHGDNKLVHGQHSDLGLGNEPYAISDVQLDDLLRR